METVSTEVVTENKSCHYDFSASQDDSPVKEYKPLNWLKNSQAVKQPDPETIVTDSQENKDTLQALNNCVGVNDAQLAYEPQVKEKLPIRRTVCYVCSEELIQRCNQMIKIPMRADIVHFLIEGYGLLKFMRVVRPRPATYDQLTVFHDPDYIDFLKRITDVEDEEKYDEEAQQFGLSYDCPAHVGVYEYAALVSGATLQAAESLIDGTADVAINWYGGWHHGKKDSASGFCYTNDVVLGILKLREKFDRVLYVDLDLHHGDGVEDAFCTTNKVLTVSVHKFTSGFFPGTGSLDDIGYNRGKYYSINVPLLDGIKDPEFVALMYRVLNKVNDHYKPDVIICQCGADGVAGDPMESFNLTPLSLGRCVQLMLSWKLPVMLLGGGGYHHANTARCWAYLTGVVLGRKLNNDIPEHKYILEYGPDYELGISAGNMKDSNNKEYLQGIYRQLMEMVNHIS